VLFSAKLLGVPFESLALGVGRSTVHHAEFQLSPTEQQNLRGVRFRMSRWPTSRPSGASGSKPANGFSGSGWSQARPNEREADRGRHPAFPSFNVLAGGSGSLAEVLQIRMLSSDLRLAVDSIQDNGQPYELHDMKNCGWAKSLASAFGLPAEKLFVCHSAIVTGITEEFGSIQSKGISTPPNKPWWRFW